MKPRVLDEDASAGPKVQIAVGGEETAVEEVERFKDDEGADEGGLGCVVVRGKDCCQATCKGILKCTERKIRVRANTNCLTTGDEVRDPEVVGKLPILGDNTDVMDGSKSEWLDRGEQWGMVDEDRDGGDFYGETGGDFVSGAVFGAAKGVDTNVLVGVLVVLINTRRVREDDGRRNVLLVVKMGERRQGTGRRNRGQRQDRVMEWSGGAQTSVSLCGGFYWRWDVKFSIGKGFYSFSDTVIINGRRASVTGGEPVLLCGRLDVDGAVDGGPVVVNGWGVNADGRDWTVDWGDGVRVLQLGRDGGPNGLRSQRESGGDGVY
jgi:hypothetical protein